MDHAKTTILGIITIAASVLGALKLYLTGAGASVDLTSVITAVTAGWGLIHAADGTNVAPK